MKIYVPIWKFIGVFVFEMTPQNADGPVARQPVIPRQQLGSGCHVSFQV